VSRDFVPGLGSTARSDSQIHQIETLRHPSENAHTRVSSPFQRECLAERSSCAPIHNSSQAPETTSRSTISTPHRQGPAAQSSRRRGAGDCGDRKAVANWAVDVNSSTASGSAIRSSHLFASPFLPTDSGDEPDLNHWLLNCAPTSFVRNLLKTRKPPPT